MNKGKCKVENNTAYFFATLMVLITIQAVVIAQPALGQCMEPTQERTTAVTSPIETILADNSSHHLGNDIKEDLTPKEPEGITYTKKFFLDSEFESLKFSLMAKSVSPYEINATEYLDRVYINDVEVALLNCYFKAPPASSFNMDTKLEDDLNKGIISEELRITFKNNGYPLSNDAFIIPWNGENIWTVSDPTNSQKFTISKEGGKLNVYPPSYSPQPSESAEVDISFDSDLLKIGNNTIKITSGSNKDGSNYDDFEFYQLTLKGIRKTGWVLSGRIQVGDEPMFPARVSVSRHGTGELVSSFETTRPDGLYSLNLSNGEYDVKVEAWNEFSNPHYDIKTIAINNSNVNLDFKASKSFSTFLPTVLAFFIIPFILPSIMAGFIIAIFIYGFIKKTKTAVIGFVLGTAGTCIINLLILFGLVLFGLGGAWLNEPIFETFYPGIPCFVTWLLLLSAGITFILVAVPIIFLNRRKVS